MVRHGALEHHSDCLHSVVLRAAAAAAAVRAGGPHTLRGAAAAAAAGRTARAIGGLGGAACVSGPLKGVPLVQKPLRGSGGAPLWSVYREACAGAYLGGTRMELFSLLYQYSQLATTGTTRPQGIYFQGDSTVRRAADVWPAGPLFAPRDVCEEARRGVLFAVLYRPESCAGLCNHWRLARAPVAPVTTDVFTCWCQK